MALTLIANCPACAQALKVTEQHVGRNIRCPACTHAFAVTTVRSGSDSTLENAVPPGQPSIAEHGDSLAQRRLFEQYSLRLARVAAQHIHPALLKRFDSEDVVQSVFRTFFRRNGNGEFQIEHSQELWALLVTITLRKTCSHARRHRAACRDVQVEVAVSSDLQLLDREASPEDALAFLEEVDVALQGLPDKSGEILSLRLEGKDKSEIARELNISRQTVHRLLGLLQERLTARLERFSEESTTDDIS